MECDNPNQANLEMFYSPLGNMTMCEGRFNTTAYNGNYKSVFEEVDLSTPVLIHARVGGQTAGAAPDDIASIEVHF